MKGDPFMERTDLEAARQNRERQRVVYPDIRQETDASKEQRRATPVKPAKVEQIAVWNSTTKRFKFHQVEVYKEKYD